MTGDSLPQSVAPRRDACTSSEPSCFQPQSQPPKRSPPSQTREQEPESSLLHKLGNIEHLLQKHLENHERPHEEQRSVTTTPQAPASSIECMIQTAIRNALRQSAGIHETTNPATTAAVSQPSGRTAASTVLRRLTDPFVKGVNAQFKTDATPDPWLQNPRCLQARELVERDSTCFAPPFMLVSCPEIRCQPQRWDYQELYHEREPYVNELKDFAYRRMLRLYNILFIEGALQQLAKGLPFGRGAQRWKEPELRAMHRHAVAELRHLLVNQNFQLVSDHQVAVLDLQHFSMAILGSDIRDIDLVLEQQKNLIQQRLYVPIHKFLSVYTMPYFHVCKLLLHSFSGEHEHRSASTESKTKTLYMFLKNFDHSRWHCSLILCLQMLYADEVFRTFDFFVEYRNSVWTLLLVLPTSKQLLPQSSASDAYTVRISFSRSWDLCQILRSYIKCLYEQALSMYHDLNNEEAMIAVFIVNNHALAEMVTPTRPRVAPRRKPPRARKKRRHQKR